MIILLQIFHSVWLPVKVGIYFVNNYTNMEGIAYKGTSTYIKDNMLNIKENRSDICSNDSITLKVPKTKLK